jgi:DNA-binding NarL/FixJ family response regulator
VAEALQCLLAPEFDPVGVVGDVVELVEAAGRLRPDVVVAGTSIPGLDGIDALVRLQEGGNHVPVVFLTMHADAALARRALEAGASGYVLKQSATAELVLAIRAALAGRSYVTPRLAGDVRKLVNARLGIAGNAVASLTPRQREVLQLLAGGYSARRVASRLSISVSTVNFHKYQIMDVLHLRSNAALIQLALRSGLVEPQPPTRPARGRTFGRPARLGTAGSPRRPPSRALASAP